MTRITRVEVIDENGRSYVNWKEDNDITLSYQDDGRTLKVFVNKVKPKSPVEEAYKDWWGEYPGTEIWTSDDETRWQGFQAGYEFAYEENVSETPQERGERVHKEMEELVRESVKWCEEHPDESVEDYLTPQGPQGPVGPGPGPKGVIVGYEPTPQTPEQVAAGLKEAFRESVKQGVVSSSNKPQTLYDLIADWWDEIFMNNNEAAVTIESLVDDIEKWLPKEQSAAGSQNAYVECSVEGFNDAINKIRRKLR